VVKLQIKRLIEDFSEKLNEKGGEQVEKVQVLTIHWKGKTCLLYVWGTRPEHDRWPLHVGRTGKG